MTLHMSSLFRLTCICPVQQEHMVSHHNHCTRTITSGRGHCEYLGSGLLFIVVFIVLGERFQKPLVRLQNSIIRESV